MRLRTLVRAAADWRELRATPRGLLPLVMLAAIGLFQTLDTQVFTIAAPSIVRDLGVGLTSFLGVLSLIGTIGTFATLLIAWYSDRARRVALLGVGTLLSGVGAVLSSRGGLGGVGLGRIVDETSNIAASTPQFSLLADYYPPRTRGKAFAALGTMGQVGALISVITAGIAVQTYGWRPTLVAAGLPLVVLGVLTMLVLREPIRGYWERREAGDADVQARVEDEPVSIGEGFRITFSVRTLRRLFVGSMWTAAGSLVYSNLVGFFLADYYGLNAVGRSLVVLPTIVVGLIGGFLGGGLLDVFGRRSPGLVLGVLGVFAVVAAFGVAGVAFGPPLALFIAAGCVVTFGFALVGPAAGAVYAQVIPPAVRTQSLAVLALATIPGLVVAVPLDGALTDHYGYTAGVLFAVPLLLIGAVIQWTAAPLFEVDRKAAEAVVTARRDLEVARRAGDDTILVCRQVTVGYDGTPVLFGIDLTIRRGEIVALLGTNGAGKSTLLRAISGTQEASSGAIVVAGRDITHMPPHEIARRGVGHMPGGRGIFPDLSVRENLALATWALADAGGLDERMEEVLEQFPVLRSRLRQPAAALSGGEQQMLALGQAMLSRPQLLLIDELSLGLSPAVVGELLEVVRRINRGGTTVVVVEQSVNVALTIASRAVFLEKGEVRFDGPTAGLFARPDVLRAVYVKGTGTVSAAPPPRRPGADAEERPPALSVTGIVKRFGGVTALDSVDLRLDAGQVLGLIGPNGSGKTTLFDVISGYQRADSGRVEFRGVDISALNADERARRGLIRRFQDAVLFPTLTVEEALLVGCDQQLAARSAVMTALGLLPVRRSERRARRQVERLVDLLNIGDYRTSFVRELSTGVRRLVDIAFVLATNPRVLLLDEPSAGIAQAEAENLAPLIGRIRSETGCSILVIEHDIPLITAVADELVALDRGRVIARGVARAVLDDEGVIDAYLGTSDAAIRRSGALA